MENRLMFFEKAILKMSSYKKQFWKNCILERAILKMSVLSKQFWKSIFKFYFLLFERAILKIFGGNNFEKMFFLEGTIFKSIFWKCISSKSNFENVFFDWVIFKMFKWSNFKDIFQV